MIYYIDQSCWLFNIKRLDIVNVNVILKLARFNKIQQNFLVITIGYTYYSCAFTQFFYIPFGKYRKLCENILGMSNRRSLINFTITL